MKIAFVLKQSIGPGGLTLKRKKTIKEKDDGGKVTRCKRFSRQYIDDERRTTIHLVYLPDIQSHGRLGA